MLRVINTAARMAPKSVVAASPRPVNMRFASTVTDPKVKANALIDALPGNSLVSKTGILTLGTALAAAAISQELVVANEEFVVAGAFIIFATYLGQMIRAPYTQWADGQIQVGPHSLERGRRPRGGPEGRRLWADDFGRRGMRS
jgi:F-type H+-transporting ATPase subunit b